MGFSTSSSSSSLFWFVFALSAAARTRCSRRTMNNIKSKCSRSRWFTMSDHRNYQIAIVQSVVSRRCHCLYLRCRLISFNFIQQMMLKLHRKFHSISSCSFWKRKKRKFGNDCATHNTHTHTHTRNGRIGAHRENTTRMRKQSIHEWRRLTSV